MARGFKILCVPVYNDLYLAEHVQSVLDLLVSLGDRAPIDADFGVGFHILLRRQKTHFCDSDSKILILKCSQSSGTGAKSD